MSKASPLEQALKDAWLAGYGAAMERVTHDTETSAAYDFQKYMERVVESLENRTNGS